MPQDFYADGEDAAPTAPESESASKTALVPKEFCPGMNPGDTFTAKIVRAAEDQYEIEYVDSGESEEPESEPAPEPVSSPAMPEDSNYA